MTDILVRLREVWERFENDEDDGVPYCDLVYDNTPAILDVLAEAELLASIDDYEGPRVPYGSYPMSALSALKGGP